MKTPHYKKIKNAKEKVMLGSGEIIVILFVVLILFGGKKLPEFAQSLGKGIREFKKACYGEEELNEKYNSFDKREEKITTIQIDPNKEE